MNKLLDDVAPILGFVFLVICVFILSVINSSLKTENTRLKQQVETMEQLCKP